jgi:hypothetical protein
MVKKYDLNRHDAAILTWAKTDPKVRDFYHQVMDRRVEYIKNPFRDLGFSGDDLEVRSRIFATYVSWENHLFDDSSHRKRNKWLKLQLDLLMRK